MLGAMRDMGFNVVASIAGTSALFLMVADLPFLTKLVAPVAALAAQFDHHLFRPASFGIRSKTAECQFYHRSANGRPTWELYSRDLTIDPISSSEWHTIAPAGWELIAEWLHETTTELEGLLRNTCS